MYSDLIENHYFNFFQVDFGHLGFAGIVLTRIWSSPNQQKDQTWLSKGWCLNPIYVHFFLFRAGKHHQ